FSSTSFVPSTSWQQQLSYPLARLACLPHHPYALPYSPPLVFTSPLTHALIPFSPSPQAGSAKSPSHTGLSQLYFFGFPSSGETSPNRLTVPLPLETHHTPDTRPDQPCLLPASQPASHSVCLSVSLLPTYPLPPLLFFPFPLFSNQQTQPSAVSAPSTTNNTTTTQSPQHQRPTHLCRPPLHA
ncbi:hypothetical protein GQ607_007306, partial [Colletotrichum asianum]